MAWFSKILFLKFRDPFNKEKVLSSSGVTQVVPLEYPKLMIMSRTRRDEAESLEDARIWATDMAGAGAGAGHYEKIGMRQYETIGSMNQQV